LDGGLSYAEVESVGVNDGSVTIELQHLDPEAFYNNPDLITRSIVVSSTGRIYAEFILTRVFAVLTLQCLLSSQVW